MEESHNINADKSETIAFWNKYGSAITNFLIAYDDDILAAKKLALSESDILSIRKISNQYNDNDFSDDLNSRQILHMIKYLELSNT